MAKPSTKREFIPAECEWLASILSAGLNGLESVVWLEVVLQCYSLARRDRATLSPADIAARTGHKPPNVSRAIRGLVAKGMLLKLGEQSYRPVEDYAAWDLGERPEARAARIRYVGQAPKLARSHRQPARPGEHDPQLQLPFQDAPPVDPSPALPPPDVISSDQGDDQIRSSDRIRSDNEDDQIRSSSIIKFDNDSQGAPIEERPRGIESLRERLRVFFREDEGSSEVAGEVVKKTCDFQSGARESPEDLVARTIALHRGRIDG